MNDLLQPLIEDGQDVGAERLRKVALERLAALDFEPSRADAAAILCAVRGDRSADEFEVSSVRRSKVTASATLITQQAIERRDAGATPLEISEHLRELPSRDAIPPVIRDLYVNQSHLSLTSRIPKTIATEVTADVLPNDSARQSGSLEEATVLPDSKLRPVSLGVPATTSTPRNSNDSVNWTVVLWIMLAVGTGLVRLAIKSEQRRQRSDTYSSFPVAPPASGQTSYGTTIDRISELRDRVSRPSYGSTGNATPGIDLILPEDRHIPAENTTDDPLVGQEVAVVVPSARLHLRVAGNQNGDFLALPTSSASQGKTYLVKSVADGWCEVDFGRSGTRWVQRHEVRILEEAVLVFAEMIAEDPTDAKWLFARATTYEKLGESDLAIDDLTAAIEQDPNKVVYFDRRSTLLSRVGDHQAAIDDLTQAIELTGGAAWCFCRRGGAYVAQEQFDRAIADFDMADGLGHSCTYGYNNRGRARAALGNYERAISDYRSALEVDSEYIYAYRNMSTAYRKLERYEEAYDTCTRALEVRPDDPWCLRQRVSILVDAEDFPRAIEDADAALSVLGDDEAVYRSKGVAYARLRRDQEALVQFEKAVKYGPAVAVNYLNRGISKKKLGIRDGLVADFEMSDDLFPLSDASRKTLISLYKQEGEYLLAKHHREILFEAARDDAARCNALAWLLATCPYEPVRDGARAVVLARKACVLSDWENSGYIETLAAALAENGEYIEASQYQDRAIQMAADEKKERFRARLELYRRGESYTSPIELVDEDGESND